MKNQSSPMPPLTASCWTATLNGTGLPAASTAGKLPPTVNDRVALPLTTKSLYGSFSGGTAGSASIGLSIAHSFSAS